MTCPNRATSAGAHITGPHGRRLVPLPRPILLPTESLHCEPGRAHGRWRGSGTGHHRNSRPRQPWRRMSQYRATHNVIVGDLMRMNPCICRTGNGNREGEGAVGMHSDRTLFLWVALAVPPPQEDRAHATQSCRLPHL